MTKILNIIGKLFMVIGIVTVFIVTAVIAGFGLGAGIAMFEAELDDGKTVVGVGKFNEVQPSQDVIQTGGSVIGGA